MFAKGIADPTLSDPVTLGRDHLVEILTDSSTITSMVTDAWGDTSRETEFHAHVDSWRRRFTG